MAVPVDPRWQAKPVKPVTESAREREAFRYEPLLAEKCRFNYTGRPLPASELLPSTDTILTALAQLGTYQTRTERALVSLFDTNHQFIIAEAAPSSSLIPGPLDAPLWLCGTAIPRSHGTCEHVLYDTSDSGSDGSNGMLPLTLVPDLALDDRFNLRPYCLLGNSSPRFFAGVPIRTRRGINIGVFCVLKSTPCETWTDQDTRYIRDISNAIMDHLEANRTRLSHRRNERMTRGLGSFMEGKSTISGWQHGPNSAAFANDPRLEGALDSKQQVLELQRQGENEHLPDYEVPADSPVYDMMLQNSPDVVQQAESSFSPFKVNKVLRNNSVGAAESSNLLSDHAALCNVFSKASNIIRESFEVEGCFFFDVTPSLYVGNPIQSPLKETRTVSPGQSPFTSSSDDQQDASSNTATGSYCDLLGFSTTDTSSINSSKPDASEGLMPKKFLAKLLRRYPNGKIFNFDADGELQSMDSSEDDGTFCFSPIVDKTSVAEGGFVKSTPDMMRKRHANNPFRRQNEGALIQKAFPGSRTVAFNPVWDSKRERWLAGGFVYSFRPSRFFTVEGELSFLRAFTMLVAAEVLNLEALQAGKAKADVLGSLSHELRSPLHGVILGTELLNDTDLSVFQGNATHTIETCCRTLLDTIDHLLDYSKLNSPVARQNTKEASKIFSNPRKRDRVQSFSNKNHESNIRLDGLIEEVVESVFAGFSFQHMSARQLSKKSRKSSYSDTAATDRLDSSQASEQLGPVFDASIPGRSHSERVDIHVWIDPSCNWAFDVQAGALRRIIMNLFGNSLKYTSKGSIRISLSQSNPMQHQPSKDKRTVKLVVHDTGKGITNDYLRHELFKPFSQEDELAPGTGLGLSIVKRITSQLRGRITVDSQVGTGTIITVTLPLQQTSQSALELPISLPEDTQFEEQVRELQGLRIRLSGFNGDTNQNAADDNTRNGILRGICEEWLRMEIISDDRSTSVVVPDVLLWSSDTLPKSSEDWVSKTPNVVVCQDAFEAYERFRLDEENGQAGIFEFISQPLGPRKLAKSIALAYRRWMGLSKFALTPSSPRGMMMPAASLAQSSMSSQTSSSKVNESNGEVMLPEAKPVGAPLTAPSQSALMNKEVTPPLCSLPELPATVGVILLVDDNHINLKTLSTYMSKLGHPFKTAVNGKEAVDVYTQHPSHYAGVLMDMSMPVMDGFEATRRI